MPVKLSSFLSKFLGPSASSSPAPTASTPLTGEDWVKELDDILNKHQADLDTFYQKNVGNRLLRRNINHLRINEPPHDLGLPKKPLQAKLLPGTLPATPPGPGTNPKKAHLPINPIMESGQRLFKAYHSTLSTIITAAYKDVHQYLVKLVSAFHYTPANYEFRTLLTDLVRGKITGLDKSSKQEIIAKIRIFIRVIKELQTWVAFFKDTEGRFSKKKKI